MKKMIFIGIMLVLLFVFGCSSEPNPFEETANAIISDLNDSNTADYDSLNTNTTSTNSSTNISISQIQNENIVARVNDEVITYEELDRQYVTLSEEYKPILTRTELLDRMIGFEVLRQNAKKEGILVKHSELDKIIEGMKGFLSDEEFRMNIEIQYYNFDSFRNELKDTIIVQKYISQNEPYFELSKDELIELYKEYKETNSQEYIRASHILVSDYALAREIKEMLDGGEYLFETLAYTYSEGPSASSYGDLGWFTWDQMVPEFEKTAFALEINQISDIVKTEFGYHIIMLTDKHEQENNVSYEEILPFLEFTLFNHKQTDNTDKFLEFTEKEKEGAYINITY